jgi:hypothetical protein
MATELAIGARVAAMTAIRAVCGLEGVDILKSQTPGPPHYAATFTGWSPSLHKVEYLLHAHCGTDPGDPEFAEDLAASFTAVLGEQRRRLADGMAIGLIAPMETWSEGADEIETGELMVDAALVSIMRDKGLDAHDELLEVLDSVHRQDALHEGGALLEGQRGVVAETPQGRVIGMALDLGPLDSRHTVTFDGLTLEITGLDLPATALTVLAGKPLRSLIEVHPLLDGRMVFGAERIGDDRGPGVRIALEFDLVRLSSLKES